MSQAGPRGWLPAARSGYLQLPPRRGPGASSAAEGKVRPGSDGERNMCFFLVPLWGFFSSFILPSPPIDVYVALVQSAQNKTASSAPLYLGREWPAGCRAGSCCVAKGDGGLPSPTSPTQWVCSSRGSPVLPGKSLAVATCNKPLSSPCPCSASSALRHQEPCSAPNACQPWPSERCFAAGTVKWVEVVVVCSR